MIRFNYHDTARAFLVFVLATASACASRPSLTDPAVSSPDSAFALSSAPAPAPISDTASKDEADKLLSELNEKNKDFCLYQGLEEEDPSDKIIEETVAKKEAELNEKYLDRAMELERDYKAMSREILRCYKFAVLGTIGQYPGCVDLMVEEK